MKRILKSVCLASVLFGLLFVLIANPSFLATAAASEHPAKGKKHDRREKRLPSKPKATDRRQRMSAAEMRAERRRASAQPSSSKTRSSNAKATKRQRAAELRRIEARRRAEAARLAAIARQRAIVAAMRDEVHSMIIRDNSAGEDSEVRRVAINALGDHAGTVVVMDPKTGRVYSIVNQEWALRRGFKPCSTIKLVTGLAGLNEKVIDPIDSTNVSGTYHIDLTDALAYSNNAYFQQVGGRVGFDKMIAYARWLGLGEKTGINAANEFSGQVPKRKPGFSVNHMSSHGDDFKVTAVQLATLVSAMANGGSLLSPRVPRTSQEDAKFKPRVRRQLNFNLDTLRYMVPGMVGSVNYGSGKRAHDPRETVVGKTGTCIEQGTWVGLFASYAPLVNPRLAVVVITRGDDAHGHFPAAVAGRIYRDLNGRFGTPTNLQVAATRDSRSPNDAADPKAALNEEEADEATAEAQESGETIDIGAMSPRSSAAVIPKTTRVTAANQPAPSRSETSSPTNNNVRRVLMPIPKRTEGTTKPTATSKPLSQTTAKTEPPSGTRPRRVSDIQQ